MNKLLLLLAIILLWENVCAYNILVVFPSPAKSHAILGDGYVRHLLKAGHEVTYITARPIKPQDKLEQVDISSTVENFELAMKDLSFETFLTQGNKFSDISVVYDVMGSTSNESMAHENIQKFLMQNKKRFDLVIAEWLYTDIYCGFAAIFDVPYIWSSSMEPHPEILKLIDEPLNPAYFPDHMSPVTTPMTFAERVSELWKLLNLYRIRWGLQDKDEKIFRNIFGPAAAKRGISLPKLKELKYKSSLMLGNSHVSSGDAHRLPQNYIPISGYHIEDEVVPLPENLQKIMDNASNGVIYFSMGTLMKSKTMSLQFKKDLLKTFGELKQTVIWKLEEQLEDLPKNVYIVQWAPQQSVLAHPNCLLFVTHGGLLSTTEALHFAVPIIGIPLFADQYINILRAVKKGYSLRVNLGYDTPAKLKVAIQEMISNTNPDNMKKKHKYARNEPLLAGAECYMPPCDVTNFALCFRNISFYRYREKVKELSFVYHHRPTSPGAALVHWVEHVIQTKGAPHLRSPALYIPLYQKFYLDLVGLVVVACYILVQIIKLFVKLGRHNKSVSHKKTK